MLPSKTTYFSQILCSMSCTVSFTNKVIPECTVGSVKIHQINIQYWKYSINRIVCIFVLIIRSMFYLSNMLTYSIHVECFGRLCRMLLYTGTHALLTWGCLHWKWHCLLLLYINKTPFAWAFLIANQFQTMLQCIQMIWNKLIYIWRLETSLAGFQRLFKFLQIKFIALPYNICE